MRQWGKTGGDMTIRRKHDVTEGGLELRIPETSTGCQLWPAADFEILLA
jgi:hypothetical protein